jgi:hypothetical protein
LHSIDILLAETDQWPLTIDQFYLWPQISELWQNLQQ